MKNIHYARLSRVSIPVELCNTCENTTTTTTLLTTHLQILYYIFNTLNDLNEKIVNWKVVDLIEYDNLDVDFVFIHIVNHLKFDMTIYIEFWTCEPSPTKKKSTT